jgi:hypothetical protein
MVVWVVPGCAVLVLALVLVACRWVVFLVWVLFRRGLAPGLVPVSV